MCLLFFIFFSKKVGRFRAFFRSLFLPLKMYTVALKIVQILIHFFYFNSLFYWAEACMRRVNEKNWHKLKTNKKWLIFKKKS